LDVVEVTSSRAVDATSNKCCLCRRHQPETSQFGSGLALRSLLSDLRRACKTASLVTLLCHDSSSSEEIEGGSCLGQSNEGHRSCGPVTNLVRYCSFHSSSSLVIKVFKYLQLLHSLAKSGGSTN